jgi:2-polyprenyl-3-methyl-5-hydroxy-6-metoxy-1,4-benzoquinol methylase
MTNTLTAHANTESPHDRGHLWRTAGDAWGHAAADWSTLFEHYSLAVVDAIVAGAGIGPGTRVLDVACGSGWATRRMAAAGAEVAGIDAADRLVDVAVDRLPTSEIVHGSMFELPWDAETFDVVTSINGIWGGCDGALDEAHRVLRPGGAVAFSFWGQGEPIDLKPYFFAVAAHLDRSHVDGMIETNSIAKPGVAEEMLHRAGFEVAQRGRRVSVVEWPDEDVAWRALRSIGPTVPALMNSDSEAVKRDVIDSIAHCRTALGTYRFQNVHDFVIARKPA